VYKWNSFVSLTLAAILAASPLLSQGDSKAKIKALNGLAKQGRAAVPGIAAYQHDPDPAVRFAATEALIDAGGIESADALHVSCQDGAPEVQRLAVAGIVNFYVPGYVRKGIRARLNAVSDKITRSHSELVIDPWVAVRAEDRDAILAVLRQAPNRDVKLQAAEALATLRVKQALPDLYPLLQSKDDALMLAALRAIETAGDQAAAQQTVFLLRDLNDRIQARAISINGLFRNEAALPDLAEVFARGRSTASKAAALEAIAMIGSPESRGLLEQNLESREDRLRGFAAEGLGRIGATDLRPRLESLYQAEGSPRARLGQAFALVMLGQLDGGTFSPLTYLFNMLNSAAWNDYALNYLGELCRQEAVRAALRAKIAGATRAEKIGLAKILSREGAAADRPALDALANDRDRNVAEEGIRAIRALNARLP
jgi:HEAT repeat protein